MRNAGQRVNVIQSITPIEKKNIFEHLCKNIEEKFELSHNIILNCNLCRHCAIQTNSFNFVQIFSTRFLVAIFSHFDWKQFFLNTLQKLSILFADFRNISSKSAPFLQK